MTEAMQTYEIRAEARRLLSGKWETAVGTVFLMGLIISGSGAVGGILLFFAWLIILFVEGAVALGLAKFFINLAEKGELVFEEAFSGFRNNLVKAMGLNFFRSLFVFLWSLLFIVPGIIAMLRYSQAFYILNENPDIPIMEALSRSAVMIQGQKTDYLLLQLSFIGWGILCIFTFGIGFLWLSPYIKTSNAVFYRELKKINTKEEKASE